MAKRTLTNRLPAMCVFELPELGHDEHEVGTNDRNPKTGEVGHRKVLKKLPRTLTLCARDTDGDSAEVDEAVLSNPEIAAALRAGSLTVSASVAVTVGFAKAVEPALVLEDDDDKPAPASAEE